MTPQWTTTEANRDGRPTVRVWRLPRMFWPGTAVWHERGRYEVCYEDGRSGSFRSSGISFTSQRDLIAWLDANRPKLDSSGHGGLRPANDATQPVIASSPTARSIGPRCEATFERVRAEVRRLTAIGLLSGKIYHCHLSTDEHVSAGPYYTAAPNDRETWALFGYHRGACRSEFFASPGELAGRLLTLFEHVGAPSHG